MELEERLTPPEPGDEHNWQAFIDELDNRRFWVPKAAYKAFQKEQMRARHLNDTDPEQDRHQ